MKGWFEGSALFAKLVAGGVCTILVLSMLWIACTSYFTSVSARVDRTRSTAHEIVTKLFEVRTKEKNILLRSVGEDVFYSQGESEDTRAYKKELALLRQEIATLDELLPKGDVRARDIADAVNKYDSGFMELLNAYRNLGNRNWGLRGKWRKEAQQVEKLVEDSGDTGLLTVLSNLRKAEVRYAESKDREQGERTRGVLKELRDMVAPRELVRKAKLQERMDAYERALDSYMSIVERIGLNEDSGLRGRFSAAARSVEPIAQEIFKQAVADSNMARSQLKLANWGISILGVIIGTIIFYLLSRGLTRPLNMVTEAAVRIAEGDLTVDLGYVKENDLLGQALKGLFANLQSQIGEIKDGAVVLGSSTAEISSSIAQVTSSATETATAVTQTMSTTEELRQTSELSAQKAGNVSKTARSSSEKSSEAMTSISEVARAMEHIKNQMEAIGESVISLSEQSQTIGEIISTVDDLAEQSNILSVNASIEAAKTGEHGKGFAVVAQEIKSLAEQSKEATKRVRLILSEIQKATSDAVMVTEQGTRAVEQGSSQTTKISEAVGSLVESINEVDQAAVQISASSKQQLSGVEQVAAAVGDIQGSTEQNVKSMEQLEKAATALEDVGKAIKALVERYRL